MLQSLLRLLFKLDWLLLFAVAVMLSFGLVAIYSLSLSREPETFFSLKKQLVSIGIGMFAILAIARMGYKTLRSYSWVLYALANALLVAVLVFGNAIRGTKGWFAIGPINFQPVEAAKLAVIIVLARYFSAHTREPLGWRRVFESAVLVGIPVGLTMLQPDLGSALVLLGIWTLLLLTVGLRRGVLFTLVAGAVLSVIVGWFLMAPYQKERILVFLHPERDQLGQGYNVTQARIAIGAGGIFGRGIGFGSQSQLRFLPESMTDFIISAVGEELGFFGLFMLVSAFLLLCLRLVMLAKYAVDDFGAILCFGVMYLLFIHFAVNMGMNLSLLPVTGLPLPFVSYGASSMLFMLFSVGIAQSVAAERSSAPVTLERFHLS